jgi:hypothetical protein
MLRIELESAHKHVLFHKPPAMAGGQHVRQSRRIETCTPNAPKSIISDVRQSPRVAASGPACSCHASVMAEVEQEADNLVLERLVPSLKGRAPSAAMERPGRAFVVRHSATGAHLTDATSAATQLRAEHVTRASLWLRSRIGIVLMRVSYGRRIGQRMTTDVHRRSKPKSGRNGMLSKVEACVPSLRQYARALLGPPTSDCSPPRALSGASSPSWCSTTAIRSARRYL